MHHKSVFPQNSISHLSIEDNWMREVLENGYKSCQLDEDGTDMDYELKIPLPPAQLDNELVLHASSKIKMEFNDKLGRHLVATDTIAPGEESNLCAYPLSLR